MEKIRKIIEKYWDIITYLIFGVLTTVVNYMVYLPAYNLLGLSASVSNVLSWVVAVAFAYLTNKPFVFKSHDWSKETVIPELIEMGYRVFYGPDQAGTVSFVAPGDCEEFAAKLSDRGIAVRAGLHCAPLAHESAGTLDCGTVRVSFGHGNTDRQLLRFLEIVQTLR